MITNTVSLKYVISKLYRDLNINEELPINSIIEWAAEALNYIGAYGQYISKTTALIVANHKVELPCDFYRLETISYNNISLRWADNQLPGNIMCETCKLPDCFDCETFYIQDNTLYTSIENTTDQPTTNSSNTLCITYTSVPIDEEGFPLIPDDVYYMKAITTYITYMMDWQEWRKGRLTDKVFQYSEKEWLFYVNSARGSANMPSLAQLERLKNVWQRLVPLNDEYRNFFRNLGKQERVYKNP